MSADLIDRLERQRSEVALLSQQYRNERDAALSAIRAGLTGLDSFSWHDHDRGFVSAVREALLVGLEYSTTRKKETK